MSGFRQSLFIKPGQTTTCWNSDMFARYLSFHRPFLALCTGHPGLVVWTSPYLRLSGSVISATFCSQKAKHFSFLLCLYYHNFHFLKDEVEAEVGRTCLQPLGDSQAQGERGVREGILLPWPHSQTLCHLAHFLHWICLLRSQVPELFCCLLPPIVNLWCNSFI